MEDDSPRHLVGDGISQNSKQLQEFNLAAFLPRRFYAANMPVDQLVSLAAYSIRAAHDLDSAMVDGLDIAVYSDTTKQFEFEDTNRYWQHAADVDEKLRACFQNAARRP